MSLPVLLILPDKNEQFRALRYRDRLNFEGEAERTGGLFMEAHMNLIPCRGDEKVPAGPMGIAATG